MIKKFSIYSIILFISIAVVVFTYIFNLKIEQKTEIGLCLDDKEKLDQFIRNQLLRNISTKKIPEKYATLSNEVAAFFLQLQAGVENLENKQFQEAWHHWNACLTNPKFNDYLAEAYLIIGTALGERDGETSFVLLQKALKITRLSNNNKGLEYSCLNEIIRLLVSQADDKLMDQEIDKMAKSYSLQAHQLLSDSTFHYVERNAATSIYRIAGESLLWLGEDSLAHTYIDHLMAQKQYYDNPELTESYANILRGVRTYISKDYVASENYFKSAIQNIGEGTSYLNYDLELAYAYLGAVYIDQERFIEAVDCMEKSIKTLQKDYYTDIEEPLKYIPPRDIAGKESSYNIILCYLRLQYFYSKAIKNKVESVDLPQVMKLSSYTNQLIKSWFLNAADEETLLRATKLIKINNSFVVDLLWERQNEFDNVVDRVFKLETEASSFYLNYLIGLRKNISKEPNYEKIRELTMELMNAETSTKQFEDEFVQKRLLLLKMKSNLWDKKKDALKKMIYNQFLPSNLTKNEAVIKYFMSQANLYVSYYTSNNRGVKKLKRVNFSDKLKQFNRAVKTKVQPQDEQRFFYNLLIKPLEKELQGITNLTILSDEMLAGITFEQLQNEKGEFLISNFAIKYAYSAKNLGQETLPQIENILAFAPGFEGNSSCTCIEKDVVRNLVDSNSVSCCCTLHQSLTPISSSINEVIEIGKLFEDKQLESMIYTSNKATKANLIDCCSTQNVVHIATHGISNDEYDNGLFFTLSDGDNGFLGQQELYQLDINADLVVLSACQTAKGKIVEGEGVMALPRGFIYAGVPNVIASLWKVHDEKTKDLMVAFYKHLLEDKVSYAEALRLAKLDCIAKGFLPVDWAGFVLIGN